MCVCVCVCYRTLPDLTTLTSFNCPSRPPVINHESPPAPPRESSTCSSSSPSHPAKKKKKKITFHVTTWLASLLGPPVPRYKPQLRFALSIKQWVPYYFFEGCCFCSIILYLDLNVIVRPISNILIWHNMMSSHLGFKSCSTINWFNFLNLINSSSYSTT